MFGAQGFDYEITVRMLCAGGEKGDPSDSECPVIFSQARTGVRGTAGAPSPRPGMRGSSWWVW